jgi:hypothetical protein
MIILPGLDADTRAINPASSILLTGVEEAPLLIYNLLRKVKL